MRHSSLTTTAAYHLGYAVTAVYHMGRLVWEAVSSCFGKGWNNDLGWNNDDGWSND